MKIFFWNTLLLIIFTDFCEPVIDSLLNQLETLEWTKFAVESTSAIEFILFSDCESAGIWLFFNSVQTLC